MSPYTVMLRTSPAGLYAEVYEGGAQRYVVGPFADAAAAVRAAHDWIWQELQTRDRLPGLASEPDADPTLYLDEPEARVLWLRHNRGACPVCGSDQPACACRWCPTCRRFWHADALPFAERDQRPSAGPRFGIAHVPCAGCAS